MDEDKPAVSNEASDKSKLETRRKIILHLKLLTIVAWFGSILLVVFGFHIQQDYKQILSYKTITQGLVVSDKYYSLFFLPVVEFTNPIDHQVYHFDAWDNVQGCGHGCSDLSELHDKIDNKIPQAVAFDPANPSHAVLVDNRNPGYITPFIWAFASFITPIIIIAGVMARKDKPLRFPLK